MATAAARRRHRGKGQALHVNVTFEAHISVHCPYPFSSLGRKMREQRLLVLPDARFHAEAGGAAAPTISPRDPYCTCPPPAAPAAACLPFVRRLITLSMAVR